MKVWGLSLLFVVSGLLAQEERQVLPLETLQLVQDQDAVFPDWLQAQREPFLQRAIFDFGQAFFRIRGMDARYTEQRFNGFPMNSLYDGRPEWQQWAGLNDVTRNEWYALGIQLSEEAFGGLQGARTIWTQPTTLYQGTRMTVSQTNRNYRHRLLATHAGLLHSELSYAISLSRRWANEGYVEGSPYDAWAGYLGVEWNPSAELAIVFTGVWNRNKRIRMPALTEEVNDLKGNQYNPWWGEWDDNKRVANGRHFESPMIMTHIKGKTKGLGYKAGISYQNSRSSRDRLGYYNAPNPDPTYYRYLPSFYLNSPLGADHLGANAARYAFVQSGQLNWQNLVRANTNPIQGGKASYNLYGDHKDTRRITAYARVDIPTGSVSKAQLGGYWVEEQHTLYAEIADLLGASYHKDIDPFSETENDLDGALQKEEGDSFQYHFLIGTSQTALSGQWRLQQKKWQFFLAGNWLRTKMQRRGRFRNGRFPHESAGDSELLSFDGYGAKAGLQLALNGRHQVSLNGMYNQVPATVRNAFVNPREHNRAVPDIGNEEQIGLELNYRFRLPQFWGRITAFKNGVENRTEIKSFYVDSGLGSDFVREVATGIELQYKGLEWAVKYQVSSDVAIDLTGSIGRYTYTDEPQIRINYDPAELPADSGELTSYQDLGGAAISGYHSGQGPETALALGITYNDPDYWWTGLSLNYMSDRYLRPTFITRTASFLLNPETGQPFKDLEPEDADRLLKQRMLPSLYLLNIIGGKSWKMKDKYLSLFLSCSNVFDLQFATGGYEQSRNGNYEQMARDQLSGNPSFGPKFWYNQGRSFFVNLALRL